MDIAEKLSLSEVSMGEVHHTVKDPAKQCQTTFCMFYNGMAQYSPGIGVTCLQVTSQSVVITTDSDKALCYTQTHSTVYSIAARTQHQLGVFLIFYNVSLCFRLFTVDAVVCYADLFSMFIVACFNSWALYVIIWMCPGTLDMLSSVMFQSRDRERPQQKTHHWR